jgi:hypothetical protein
VAAAAASVAAFACAGCDQGTQHEQPVGAGGPITVVAQYPAENASLAPDGRIELAFNRYLLPSTVTRQAFQLHSGGATGTLLTPTISYDPVARIVTITPISTMLLTPDQAAVVVIDPAVLRAIDGATLDPRQATTYNFPVVAGGGGAASTQQAIDYCRDIFPVLNQKCGQTCHGAGLMYEGLDLATVAAIAATAIGKTAHGANTGPQSTPQSPGPVFGVDMPIIDPGSGGGGNPANSWLLYKLLLAVPPATSSTMYPACDGGTCPVDVSTAHLAVQPALADEANDGERANLANEVQGREMPFPTHPELPLDQSNSQALTVDELERVSLWIATVPVANGGGSALLPSTDCQ